MKKVARYSISALALLFTHILPAQSAESDQGHELEEYVLRAGDRVALNVYQEGDLNKDVTIDRSGSASFELIGDVQLAGKTLKQAEKSITELYKKDYLVNPMLNLEVAQYVQNWVLIVGDISNPGTVDFGSKKELKLSSSLTKAGGVPNGSVKGKVEIERASTGDLEVHPLSKADSVKVYHGDMVMVRLDSAIETELEEKFFTVAGFVGRPGRVTMPKEGKFDIITAIATAGDFTRLADRKDITIRRPSNGSYRTIELDMSKVQAGKVPMFHVEEGDIIIVKERFW